MDLQKAINAAKAKKHILIEKPVALTWEDSKIMQEVINESGVKTLVGYVLHWNPLFLNAKKLKMNI